MEIIDKANIYDPDNVGIIFVSVALFVLQTVLALMDTNTFIKDFGVGDATDSIISKARFYYSYFAGYMTYFLKLTVSLFSLLILLTVIRAGVLAIWNILRPVQAGKGDEFRGSMYSMLKIAAKSNALWVLGVYHMERFFKTFLVFSPLLILLITLGFSIFLYERKSLEEMKDEENIQRVHNVLNTLHHHNMFFLVFAVFAVIIYIVSNYVQTFARINPLSDS